MNRIKKELAKRGIIYNSMDNIYNQIYYCPENDNTSVFVGVENGYILTVFFSEVIDPIIYIYDRNFMEVGQQYLYPEHCGITFGCFNNRWGSAVR